MQYISGQPFDEYLQEHIFALLNLMDRFFEVPRSKRVDLHSGGGGLVSTAMDYARFPEAMCNGGRPNGVLIFGPKTVAFVATNH